MDDAITRFVGKYEPLSNFHMCEVHHEGLIYPSAEHAYQAAKTLDLAVRRRIAACPTPGDAKRRGRRLLLRPNWDDIKLRIMLAILRDKFLREHTERTHLLFSTHPRRLSEGNYWHDNYWGICVCSRCPGTGEDRLGKLLMLVREHGLGGGEVP